jgi:5-methylcytosine-specific restriction endonuclease McrA
MFVFVISNTGKQLMPCSPARARHLLRDGEAKVIRRTPFTIKLLIDCPEIVQEVVAGMDSGSKKIGCAAVANGRVVYQSEIQIRNDVSRKMKQRAMYRRTRRSRKTRYRKSRWLNRSNSRREGRLAPSLLSKVNSHLREKRFVESILPVSKWILETASFDIHKISNPYVKGKEYTNGKQKDFYNTKAYIRHRDNYQCQKCKKKNVKLHVHHIVFRSKNGTDTPDNLITLCDDCHDKLHKGDFKLKGRKSKTKHATETGIVKSQLKKRFVNFIETFGYETKYKREQILKLEKTHYNDAVAICCLDKENFKLNTDVFYKKHVSKGDYKQTRGSRSEKRIPTGKLFCLRKFDLIKTSKGIGFIKAKRSRGFFVISDIFDNILGDSSVKKNCSRISARSTTLIERRCVKEEMLVLA